MPTKAESRALAFFAGLFALGGLMRFADGIRPSPDVADSSPLDAQLARVDSARSTPSSGQRARKSPAAQRAATDTGTAVADPPPGLPPELAAMAGWFSRAAQQTADNPRRPSTPKQRSKAPAVAALRTSDARHIPMASRQAIDLDTATEAEIETLPGIGPSLARRIVADRTQHGAFGSLDGLGRVKGVGAVLSARLAPRVTFSGIARPD
jgi:competence protein ComEA